MGQMKAYAEWAKDKGYLDDDYEPINPNASSMDYVDEFVKKDVSNFLKDAVSKGLEEIQVKNMASSHFTNLINRFIQST